MNHILIYLVLMGLFFVFCFIFPIPAGVLLTIVGAWHMGEHVGNLSKYIARNL